MEEKKLTVEEVLEITARLIAEISVPVGLTEQIGVPLTKVIGNLNAVLEALRRGKEPEDGREADPE